MKYTVNIGASGYEVIMNGETIIQGDLVYQDDLPKWGPKRIKKFFYPEGNENLYAQFDEGYGSNDGCLPVLCLTKIKPTDKEVKP